MTRVVFTGEERVSSAVRLSWRERRPALEVE